MKVIAPFLFVLAVLAMAILPPVKDRQQAVSRVSLLACASELEGGGEADAVLLWRLPLPDAEPDLSLNLTNDQLIALGFDRHMVGLIGSERPDVSEWPKPKTVWLSLRSDSLSGDRFQVDSVATRREALPRHADGIILRARVGFLIRGERPRPKSDTLPADQPPEPAPVLRVGVFQLIPGDLHLTSTQEAGLRKATVSGEGCADSPVRLVIAMGRRGALWVERLEARPAIAP